MGILDKLKGEWESMKKQGAYKRAAESNIQKKQQAAYYKAKEMEAIKFAKKKAAHESKQKYVKLTTPRSTMMTSSAPMPSMMGSPRPMTQKKKPIGKIPSWNASIDEVNEYHRKNNY